MPCGKHGFVNTFCNNLFYFSILFSCHLERFPAVFENEPKGPLPFCGAQYHQAILSAQRVKSAGLLHKSLTLSQTKMGCYKSLPHQIRRVFERRNAQKPEFYGVRRFAKNRSFTAFGVSRSEIGIAGRNVTVTPWSGCDEMGLITGAIYGILSSMNRRLCRLLSTCKNE